MIKKTSRGNRNSNKVPPVFIHLRRVWSKLIGDSSKGSKGHPEVKYNENNNKNNNMILPPGSRTMSANNISTTNNTNNNNNNNNSNNQHHSFDCVTETSNRMVLPAQSRNDQLNPYNRPTINYDDMKSEYERLMTFFTVPPWPCTFVHPAECARAGFFYVQEGDKVQCAFCRGVAGEWEPMDNPMTEHRRHFPRCPFICNLPVGNIPMNHGDEEEEVSPNPPEEPFDIGVDVCGPFEASALHPEMEESSRIKGCRPIRASLEQLSNEYALKECRGPCNSQMVTPPARLKSFKHKNWTNSNGQKPEALVEAGFYYTGSQDMCKCFYCDGGLRNWEASDDPWTEHARWFPKCTYVNLNKGEDFITQVAARFDPASGQASSPSTSSASIQVPCSTTTTTTATSKSASSSQSSSSSHCVRASSSSSNGSSSDEEMETNAERMRNIYGIETASTSGSSTSGVETCSINSDLSSRNSNRSDSESSHSSGEEDDTIVHKNKKLSEEKEQDLKEELRKLREARLCKICMDDEISVVFLPCCHLVSCTKCATAFTNCALCRKPVKALVKTYMS